MTALRDLATAKDTDETLKRLERLGDEDTHLLLAISPYLENLLLVYAMGAAQWARDSLAEMVREAAHVALWEKEGTGL